MEGTLAKLRRKRKKIWICAFWGCSWYLFGAMIFPFIVYVLILLIFGVHPYSEAYGRLYLFFAPAFPWTLGVISKFGYSALLSTHIYGTPFFYLMVLPFFLYGVIYGCLEKVWRKRFVGLIVFFHFVLFSYLELLLMFWRNFKV